MKKALILSGGWEGHQPVEVGEILAELLRKEGFAVEHATEHWRIRRKCDSLT